MNTELSRFAAHLRGMIANPQSAIGNPQFSMLALELFALQFKHNAAFQRVCLARGLAPESIQDWSQIPAVPAAAFKELDLTCLAPAERTAVFHSSGTTGQKPSRHFHGAESLAVYEASLWTWFEQNCGLRIADFGMICLTPPPEQAPHSSLVHMLEVVRRQTRQPHSAFTGQLDGDGAWSLDFDATRKALQSACDLGKPLVLLGAAFSFVHLLDYLQEKEIRFTLPAGSRVMETGGYKNRSRILSKPELHAHITERLGVPASDIICEYGMSELSSQAYDGVRPGRAHSRSGIFHFPPWARVQIISPESGQAVDDGETGLIRILDLANVFSVLAVQTEDLGIRRGDGFELLGRAQLSEPRGCSLMTA